MQFAFSSLRVRFLYIVLALLFSIPSYGIQAAEKANPCIPLLLDINASTSPHVHNLAEIAKEVKALRYPGMVVVRFSLPVNKDFFAIQRFLELEEISKIVPENFKSVQVQNGYSKLKFLAVAEPQEIFDLMAEMLLQWPDIRAKGTLYLHDREEVEFIFSRIGVAKDRIPFKYPFIGQIESEPNFHKEVRSKPLEKSRTHSYSNLKISWSDGALKKLKYLGLDAEEVEVLIQKSSALSLETPNGYTLPLFRKIRSKDLFWDEVVQLKVSEKFVPGRTQYLKIFEISPVSVKEERALFHDLAHLLGTKSSVITSKGLKGVRGKTWSVGEKIYVSPAITVKLEEKHGIKLSFLAEVLKKAPTFTMASHVGDDRIELHYKFDDDEMVVVLGFSAKENTTSLVTSYFKKSSR